jgi:hypothetical protein
MIINPRRNSGFAKGILLNKAGLRLPYSGIQFVSQRLGLIKGPVMKGGILVVGLLLAGIWSAQAQDNAANASRKKDALKEQGEKIQKDEASGGGDADMIRLKATEVPHVLRKTLASLEYKGWDADSSTIYGSEENDLFVVEIIGDNKKAKTFYFDGDGKPIKY